jgi:hypothetical protein
MVFGTWFVNKPNGITYIKYGIKNSIANATNVVATYMQITILT